MSDSTQPEPSSVPPAPTGAFARTAQIVRPAVCGVQWLAASPFGPFLGLIVVFGIFWGADTIKAQKLGRSSRFANVATVQKVLKDASLVGVASLGMTLIIIAGGIDLSAGAATAVCATVTAYGFLHEWPVALCLLAGFETGGLCGDHAGRSGRAPRARAGAPPPGRAGVRTRGGARAAGPRA